MVVFLVVVFLGEEIRLPMGRIGFSREKFAVFCLLCSFFRFLLFLPVRSICVSCFQVFLRSFFFALSFFLFFIPRFSFYLQLVFLLFILLFPSYLYLVFGFSVGHFSFLSYLFPSLFFSTTRRVTSRYISLHLITSHYISSYIKDPRDPPSRW